MESQRLGPFLVVTSILREPTASLLRDVMGRANHALQNQASVRHSSQRRFTPSGFPATCRSSLLGLERQTRHVGDHAPSRSSLFSALRSSLSTRSQAPAALRAACKQVAGAKDLPDCIQHMFRRRESVSAPRSLGDTPAGDAATAPLSGRGRLEEPGLQLLQVRKLPRVRRDPRDLLALFAG